MQQPMHFDLSILLVNDGGAWTAQCLQYDLAAQGDTIEAALRHFEQTFVGQLRWDLAEGRQPLEGIGQAPAEFWKTWERALRLAETRPIRMPDEVPPAWMINAMANELRVW